MFQLDTSIKYIKGVGPKKAELLNKLGIYTVEDLLHHYPKSYENYSNISSIGELSGEEKRLYRVVVTSPAVVSRVRGNMTILKCGVTDGHTNGELVFFNQAFLKPQLTVGRELYVIAKVKYAAGRFQLSGPKIVDGKDVKGGPQPTYGLTKGITNKEIKKYIHQCLSEGVEFEEIIPEEIRLEHGIASIKYAIHNIHYPKDDDAFRAARYRLVFEELLILQMALFKIKTGVETSGDGIQFKDNELLYEFIDRIPFELTGAQSRSLKEILSDMNEPTKMNRLLQGDVGSGKTIIAIISMYYAVLNGYQCSMMAPTELLAKQHYISLQEYFGDSGVRVELLVGSTTAKQKAIIYEELKNGNIDIVVGTHALIQEGVQFSHLGLTITDEQHRFGVEQRNALNSKGQNPDNLVMTATPIPRTLALILYGDLDISIIDELPPHRKVIETYVVNTSFQSRMDSFVRKQVDEGHQVYVVCPLIEENDDMPLISAEEIYDYYRKTFVDLKVELLHGKKKSSEKNEIMERFSAGEVDILVSTTVIEVGVNVPNANLMLIYNADRFGLSQLHQLRGRVGRGEFQSYCILINDNRSEISYKRMKVMESSDDGFYIAEKDLELRGPGEFFGTRQHGIPDLKIANLAVDMDILKIVQQLAYDIVRANTSIEISEFDNLYRAVGRLLLKYEELNIN